MHDNSFANKLISEVIQSNKLISEGKHKYFDPVKQSDPTARQ